MLLSAIMVTMVAAADVRATMPRPAQILADTRRVADWQIQHRNDFNHVTTSRARVGNPRDWQQATFWMAMTELADRDPRYRPLLLKMGRELGWTLGERPFHADDQLIGQVWLWAARNGGGPAAIKPTRKYFDHVLANRPTGDLAFDPKVEEPACLPRWCWVDALFMAPPTLFELTKATGDQRYAKFAHEEFAATQQYLWDPSENLFFRDSRFFDRRDAAGKKLFWSRGNGWVMAGLVRIIETLDKRDPQRARYVELFRKMAGKIVTLQRKNGFWPASLLDTSAGAPPESSGTGFMVYAFARGVDLGILDRSTYLPSALRGWSALVSAIQPDGMIGWVQKVGDQPGSVKQGDTQFYGAGAVVLAGTALHDLAMRAPNTDGGRNSKRPRTQN